MNARGVIFDLDGTLVDSLADLGESVNVVLAEKGLAPHPLEAYRRFVGDGIVALVERALGDASVDRSLLDACVTRVRAVYGERWDRKTRPYPGIASTIEKLRERRLELSVLSNKPHALTTAIITRFFRAGSFRAVLGAEVGFARKPDPAGALELSRRCGVTPEQCLYVGDTGTDMETALRAHMTPIGALWGFRDATELEAAGAAALVAKPTELLAVLIRFG